MLNQSGWQQGVVLSLAAEKVELLLHPNQFSSSKIVVIRPEQIERFTLLELGSSRRPAITEATKGETVPSQ